MAPKTPRDDLIERFDYVWARHTDRMSGLTDQEWAWTPIADDRVSLRWRLTHIAELLGAERTATWLGLPAEPDPEPAPDRARTAAEALACGEEGYRRWRRRLTSADEASLALLMGPVAGYFAESTRFAFAIHLADELIHHSAEAALLRDLFEGRAKL